MPPDVTCMASTLMQQHPLSYTYPQTNSVLSHIHTCCALRMPYKMAESKCSALRSKYWGGETLSYILFTLKDFVFLSTIFDMVFGVEIPFHHQLWWTFAAGLVVFSMCKLLVHGCCYFLLFAPPFIQLDVVEIHLYHPRMSTDLTSELVPIPSIQIMRQISAWLSDKDGIHYSDLSSIVPVRTITY